MLSSPMASNLFYCLKSATFGSRNQFVDVKFLFWGPEKKRFSTFCKTIKFKLENVPMLHGHTINVISALFLCVFIYHHHLSKKSKNFAQILTAFLVIDSSRSQLTRPVSLNVLREENRQTKGLFCGHPQPLSI